MRILYIGNIANSHERKWVLPVAQAGQEVHIISPVNKPEPGIVVHHYDPDTQYAKDNFLIRFLKKIRDMRRFINEVKPDIVHFQFVVDLAYTAPFLGFKNIVLTPWGSDILIFPQRSKKIYWLLWLTLGAAQKITIHSEQIKQRILAMRKIPGSRFISAAYSVEKNFVQNIDSAQIEKMKENYGIAPTDKVILSFRNIMEVYNLEEIIQAVAAIKQPNLKLIILHEYSVPERVAFIKDLVRRMGIESNTIFVSGLPIDQMYNFYRLADIGISFSKSDGCPVSVLECMACGLPLVVSDIPANRQLLREVSARYVALGDISGLALAMGQLLYDTDLQNIQKENAQQDFLKIGYNEDNVQKLLTLYKNL
jgi:glycosyltransferase involved in cell wall biosynthesis